MRRFRLFVLLAVLLSGLAALYYRHESGVKVEAVELSSGLMGKALPYRVVLPPGYRLPTSSGKRYPVLYLLHGWGGRQDSWLTESALARHASEHELIIVTPEGGKGWYTDSATAPSERYETYVVQELIPDVERRFRTIAERRGRGVAGYSMGGYGALKFGLKHPEMFALAASMSGALDATERTDEESIMRTFGEAESPARVTNDLQRLVAEFPSARVSLLPYFYMDCGTDDPWLESNRRFADRLLERRIPHEYRQLPGKHIWPYWDRQVREVLRLASERLSAPES